MLNNNTGLLTQWSTMFLHISISGGGEIGQRGGWKDTEEDGRRQKRVEGEKRGGKGEN